MAGERHGNGVVLWISLYSSNNIHTRYNPPILRYTLLCVCYVEAWYARAHTNTHTLSLSLSLSLQEIRRRPLTAEVRLPLNRSVVSSVPRKQTLSAIISVLPSCYMFIHVSSTLYELCDWQRRLTNLKIKSMDDTAILVNDGAPYHPNREEIKRGELGVS
jgi:hypothetical protein